MGPGMGFGVWRWFGDTVPREAVADALVRVWDWNFPGLVLEVDE